MPDGRIYGHTHEQTEDWLSAHPLMMLYIYTKFCERISKGFRVTDLNSKVNTRVVANVTPDGWKYRRTHGQKTRSLIGAMPKAGTTITVHFKPKCLHFQTISVITGHHGKIKTTKQMSTILFKSFLK